MGVSEKDFELLNALADSELSGLEKEKLKRRMDKDASLQKAYAQIMEVKAAVSSMQLLPEVTLTDTKKRRSSWFDNAHIRYTAIAATIACVFVTSVYFAHRAPDVDENPITAVAWHKAFSGNQYVVREETGPLFISINSSTDIAVPDLSASRLFLVEHYFLGKEDNETVAMHYRGFNGCKLTIWAGKKALSDIEDLGDILHYSWAVGDLHYRVLADGMDADRFTSIASFARSISEMKPNRESAETLIMAAAYDNAIPCS